MQVDNINPWCSRPSITCHGRHFYLKLYEQRSHLQSCFRVSFLKSVTSLVYHPPLPEAQSPEAMMEFKMRQYISNTSVLFLSSTHTFVFQIRSSHHLLYHWTPITRSDAAQKTLSQPASHQNNCFPLYPVLSFLVEIAATQSWRSKDRHLPVPQETLTYRTHKISPLGVVLYSGIYSEQLLLFWLTHGQS